MIALIGSRWGVSAPTAATSHQHDAIIAHFTFFLFIYFFYPSVAQKAAMMFSSWFIINNDLKAFANFWLP